MIRTHLDRSPFDAAKRGRLPALGTVAVATAALMIVGASTADAATPVGLGTAASYAVLAGAGVTNTGPSVISGDLGTSPTAAVTGFPPGLVNNGTIHAADAVALQAQSDLTTAYDQASAEPISANVAADITGSTLAPGVYKASSALALNGTVTLDGGSDPDAVFVFQAPSTLITGSGSRVALINVNPCNVFWQVGSSATIGTSTTFVGTVLALTSISVQNGATVSGRVLARNGAVTLDDNVITANDCSPRTTTTPVGDGGVVVPPIVIPIPSIPGLPSIPGVPPVITIPGLPGLPGTPPTSSVPTAPAVPPTSDTPGTPGTPNTP
jgi:hypothetical protein